MGIKGFLHTIKTFFTHTINIFDPLCPLRSIAFDCDVICHESLSVCGLSVLDEPYECALASFRTIASRYRKLQESGKRSIFVLSGRPLPAKAEVDECRRQLRIEAIAEYDACLETGDTEGANKCLRKTNYLTMSFKYELIKLFRIHSIPYMVAPYEADSQVAHLVDSGQCDVAVSVDGDLIAYGCPKQILEVDWASGVAILFTAEIPVYCVCKASAQSHCPLEDMGAKMVHKYGAKDVAVCVASIAGCDYSKGLEGYGVKKVMKAINSCKSVDVRSVIRHLESVSVKAMAGKRDATFPPTTVDSCVSIRNVFRKHIVFKPIQCCFDYLCGSGDSSGGISSAIERQVGSVPRRISSTDSEHANDIQSSDVLDTESIWFEHLIGERKCSDASAWSDPLPFMDLYSLSGVLFPSTYTPAMISGSTLPDDQSSWTSDSMKTFLRHRQYVPPTTIAELKSVCSKVIVMEKSPGYGPPRIVPLSADGTISLVLQRMNLAYLQSKVPSIAAVVSSVSASVDSLLKSIGGGEVAWRSWRDGRAFILDKSAELQEATMYTHLYDNLGVSGMYRMNFGYRRAVSMTSAVLEGSFACSWPERGPMARVQLARMRVPASMSKTTTHEVGVGLSYISRAVNESPIVTGIVFAHCDCVVGSSRACQHILCLLWIIHLLPRTRNGTAVDTVPCTSKECEWNKPSAGAVTAAGALESSRVDDIAFRALSPPDPGSKSSRAGKKEKTKNDERRSGEQADEPGQRRRKRLRIRHVDDEEIVNFRSVFFEKMKGGNARG